MSEESNPVIVYSGTAWETALLKSLLENAEIEVYLKEEIRGYLVPWHVSAGGVDPVKVMVSAEDAEKARLVVEDFELNRKSE
jgi:hypothetical protein